MNFIAQYDITADALFINCNKEEDIYETIPVTDNLIIDINKDCGLVNVEVLNLSHVLKKPVSEFYKVFRDMSGVEFSLEPKEKILSDVDVGDVDWLNKLIVGTYQIRE